MTSQAAHSFTSRDRKGLIVQTGTRSSLAANPFFPSCDRKGVDRAGLDEVLSGCPLLRTFNVNGCTSLLHLRLTAQIHLERLDLSGCVNMSLAIIESPLLKELSAVGCSSLAVRVSDGIQTTASALFDKVAVVLLDVIVNYPLLQKGREAG